MLDDKRDFAMNKLVQHRDLITHYAALAAGVTLTAVGAYLCCSATSSLSWRKVTDEFVQMRASWMCIVPGVTCVFVGGLLLMRLSRARSN